MECTVSSEVRSVKCKVWSVKCKVRRVRSVKHKV